MTQSIGRSDARTYTITLLTLFAASACSGYDSIEPARPKLTTLVVTLASPVIEVGEVTVATAAGRDQDGAPIPTGPVTWTSSAPTVAAVNPATGAILAVAQGTARITATAEGQQTAAQIITVVSAPAIRVNEVKSNRGSTRVWVELVNAARTAVDISGWMMTSKDVRQSFLFPAGTSIEAGGLLVVDETKLPFSLGADDAVLLYNRFGVLVDTFSWEAEAPTTYGRCPDEASGFVTTTAPTKGTVNACPEAA